MIKINNIQINSTKFPDGTSQTWQISDKILQEKRALIHWDFDFESEFLELAQLKDLLDSYNIVSSLYLSYLPYGRQDKEISNGTTFALNTFAKLLNSLNFKSVFILDPHSDKYKLIKNVYISYPVAEIELTFIETKSDLVCYPDNGANIKYSEILNYPKVYANKKRNQLTGKIENMELIGNVKGKNVLIIDDIIDGGGTFSWLAQILLESGAKTVNLFGTHGIFSKGLTPLLEAGINSVYTKDGKTFDYHGNICYDSYYKEYK